MKQESWLPHPTSALDRRHRLLSFSTPSPVPSTTCLCNEKGFEEEQKSPSVSVVVPLWTTHSLSGYLFHPACSPIKLLCMIQVVSNVFGKEKQDHCGHFKTQDRAVLTSWVLLKFHRPVPAHSRDMISPYPVRRNRTREANFCCTNID